MSHGTDIKVKFPHYVYLRYTPVNSHLFLLKQQILTTHINFHCFYFSLIFVYIVSLYFTFTLIFFCCIAHFPLKQVAKAFHYARVQCMFVTELGTWGKNKLERAHASEESVAKEAWPSHHSSHLISSPCLIRGTRERSHTMWALCSGGGEASRQN